MKTNKWRKWQIGAASALFIGVLFQQIKGTDAFAKAHDEALAAKSPTTDHLTSRDLAMGNAGGNGVDDGGRPHRGPGGRGRVDQGNGSAGDGAGVFGNGTAGGNSASGSGTFGNGGGVGGSSQLGSSSGAIQQQQPTVRTQTRTGRS